MRKGVMAAGVVAAGLSMLTAGCGGKHAATPASGGGGYAQPSSGAPESSPPATGMPESSPPESSPPAESSPPTESSPPVAGPVTINSKKVSLGTIIVDDKGMTLYLFEKDKNGKSACTGACLSVWPPAITNGKVTAGSGVNASWLGTTDRGDGTKQVTYHGWPLYRFAKDTQPGDMKGQDLNSFGGAWYVVGADKGDKLEK